jgi:flagellar biosynthesis chaperone FliJ
MISLGGLMGNSVKLGNMDVKLGQVVSNPFAKAFIKEAEGEDHEVSMGQNQLDTIIKMATELKAKMGENEKEIPAWIQDHISKAENYISQAAGNYHEYGTNELAVKEISSRTPKIFVKTAAVEKKIKELMADRKKAVVPYNSETDPAKKEKLKQILIKLTNQIKGYEKNLVQLRDMEEEYLQQMHADAELDTTGL